MERAQDHYDWIVLGDHPTALLSAALVARLGLSVLVVPLSPSTRARVSQSGQCLDPESNWVPGALTGAGLFSTCLAGLGIAPAELARIRRDPVSCQVLTHSHRISLSSEGEFFSRELNREFGAQAKGLGLVDALAAGQNEWLAYWKNLPEAMRITRDEGGVKRSKGLMTSPRDLQIELQKKQPSAAAVWADSRASVSELANRSGLPVLQEVCSGLWYGMVGSENPDPRAAEFLKALATSFSSASFVGGATAFRNFLKLLATRLGARVESEVDCRRIFVDRTGFLGVQMAHSGTVISGHGCLLGASLDHARSHLSESGEAWNKKLKASPKPEGWRMTLALTVNAEAIPPGMTSRNFWKEPGAPVLEIETANPADYGVMNPGAKLVFLRTVMPFSDESLDPRYQRLMAGRMFRKLTEIMPFVEFHVKRVYPDFHVESSLADFSEAYGFKSLDEIPESLRVISKNGVSSRSGVEGLFLATGEAYPENVGMGPLVAALEATAWVAHRAGLPGPFLESTR